MVRQIRGALLVAASLSLLIWCLALNLAGAQQPSAGGGDAFAPKADATRAQLKAHIEKLKRVPLAGRNQPGYGQGIVTAAEKLLADNPPESIRSFAAISLMEGLHQQAVGESNAEADTKLAAAAQQYSNDADKKVAAAAAFYAIEVKLQKAAEIAPAELPALLTELKAALKGKRPDARYQRLALATVAAINRLEDKDEKEKEFKDFGKIFATSPARDLAEYGNKMKSLQLVGAAKAGAPGEPEVDWTGKPMALAGMTVEGQQFNISNYKGKVVLVDFWASWCGPCKALLPHVKEMQAKYHDKGFEVVGVSWDKDLRALRTYLQGDPLPWVNVIGELRNGVPAFPLYETYGVHAIPTTFVVGKDGKIVSRGLRGQPLEKQIEQLLNGEDAKKSAEVK